MGPNKRPKTRRNGEQRLAEDRMRQNKARFLSRISEQVEKQKRGKKRNSVGANGVASVSGKNERKNDLKKRKRSLKSKPYANPIILSPMDAAQEAELETERKLAKKLKVKNGRLGGLDDGMNDFLEGLDGSPVNYGAGSEDGDGSEDIHEEEDGNEELLEDENEEDDENEGEDINEEDEEIKEDEDEEVDDQEEGMELNESEQIKQSSNVKYVAPHMRACAEDESEEVTHMRRQVKGLLNRLSESNVESITRQIVQFFGSFPRNTCCEIIGREVLAFCSRGPRGSEQYAATFAAFATAMASIVGAEFSAKLLVSFSKQYEDEYSRDDDLSLRNLTLLLCYMCTFGTFASDLMYDLLSKLCERLTELDVSLILIILDCCGMKLRGDNPSAMKNFISDVQKRVSELKSFPAGAENGKSMTCSKRMDFMLETILDIKNNKKRSKEDPKHHLRIKKWLKEVGVERSILYGIKWSTLLDPPKKGQWWLSGDSAAEDVEQVTTSLAKEDTESRKLSNLARAQRMNTDLRKAIFCIIMGAEDYVDAFEKLLRLDVTGKQDREIVRVIVDCCLQEKLFNKYYVLLAWKLCSHDKNHKFSLQYCLWDHYDLLDEMELHRSMNLAQFVAEMISKFSLSLAVLKINLADPRVLTARRILHLRKLFEFILEKKVDLVWNIFSRIAVVEELEPLRDSIVFFVKQYVISADKDGILDAKFRVAKKALKNVAGVLK